MPSNIVQNNDSATITWTEPTATDNSGSQTLTSSHTPGSKFSIGAVTSVEYRAVDSAGNEGVASFTVTIVGMSLCIKSQQPPCTGGLKLLHDPIGTYGKGKK